MATLNGKEILGFIAKGELTKIDKLKDEITPHIGENGNWIVDGEDTGVKAQGPQGEVGRVVAPIYLSTPDSNTRPSVNFPYTYSPTYDISSENVIIGNLVVVNFTGYRITHYGFIRSINVDSSEITCTMVGRFNGEEGPEGSAGISPHIGDNGNWFIGDTDTGVQAQGPQGEQGITPHIGDNGNWFIGDEDTGVKAQGPQGTLDQDTEETLMETVSIANAKSRTFVYDDLIGLINNLTGKTASSGPGMQIGDFLCVRQSGIPAFWVSYKMSTTSAYTYISDEQTLTDINNGVQIGRYIVNTLFGH